MRSVQVGWFCWDVTHGFVLSVRPCPDLSLSSRMNTFLSSHLHVKMSHLTCMRAELLHERHSRDALLDKNDAMQQSGFSAGLLLGLLTLWLHKSLSVPGSDFFFFFLLCLNAFLSCDSRTAAKPVSIRRGGNENTNLILASLPVVPLKSRVGDRSRPWCQTAASSHWEESFEVGWASGRVAPRGDRRTWMRLPGKQTSGLPCCESDPDLDKWLKTDWVCLCVLRLKTAKLAE